MEINIKFISEKTIDAKLLQSNLPAIMDYINISIEESLDSDDKGLPNEGNTWSWDITDGSVDHNLLFTVEMTKLSETSKSNVIEIEERFYDLDLADEFLAYSHEMTTEEMVKKIYFHEDENELIDYVDGVVVCEIVEFSFTCETFIQKIRK